MVINRENMDALFDTFNTRFNAGMTAATVDVPNWPKLADLAMVTPSTGAATVHAWLNQVPGMREWVGERVLEDLGLGKLTVTNRNFEGSVKVPRNDIEDDQYGVFAPLVQAMGENAARHWMKLAMEALTDNGNWADGNPFFAANRQLSAKSGVITNAVTDALSKAAVEAAIATVLSWKLHSGLDADVTPRGLVVGPANHALAKLIVEADLVVNGGSTVSNVSTATMLKVYVSNSLIGEHANKWYLFCEKSGMMPIGVQQRKLPVLTRMDRDSDPNVFMKNEYYYGTDSRGEGFLTLPFLAYAGGFTTVPDAGESGGGEEPGGGG